MSEEKRENRIEFVEIWNESESLNDVVLLTEKKRNAASGLAHRLRKRGIYMQRFKRTAERKWEKFDSVWNDANSLSDVQAHYPNTPGSSLRTRASQFRKSKEMQYFRAPAYKNLEDFVEIWNAAKSFDEVCAHFPHVPQGTLGVRATFWRRKGVAMQYFGNNTPLSDTEILKFVEVWNSSESAVDVARQLGATYNAVYKRAARLRKKGYALK